MAMDLLNMINKSISARNLLRNELQVTHLMINGGGALHYLRQNYHDLGRLRFVHDLDFFVKSDQVNFAENVINIPGKFQKLQNGIKNFMSNVFRTAEFYEMPISLLSKQSRWEIKNRGTQMFLYQRVYNKEKILKILSAGSLNYYAQKLVSVGGEKKHTDLIERVSKITGKDYFLASRSSR